MKTLIPILFVALLFGCSTKTPTEFAMETGSSGTEQATVNACLAWVQQQNQQEMTMINSLDKAEKGEALRHRATMDMIKNVWGKGNECKPGTNQWDAYIAYAKESETTKRQYSSDLKSVVTFGIVATGTVKLADAVMGKVGDKISTTGDNSSVTKTTTTTTSDTKSSNVGEGSSTASGGTGAATEKKESTTGEAISATALADCRTTSAGAATADELHACLSKDYGYATTIQDGAVYYNGSPL